MRREKQTSFYQGGGPVVLLGLLLVIAFLCLPLHADGENRLRVPVRVVSEEGTAVDLDPGDFSITVDGAPREIQAVFKKHKSLTSTSNPGRTLILSMQSNELTQPILRRISYIVELLGRQDALLLVSPTNIYRFPPSPDKGGMINDITSKLHRDYRRFQKRRLAAIKTLRRELRTLKGIYRSPGTFPGLYVGTIQFLAAYPSQFTQYVRSYVVPAPEWYRRVVEPLRGFFGEFWWIHIQEFRADDVISETRDVIADIKTYITNQLNPSYGMFHSISIQVNQFEKDYYTLQNPSLKEITNIIQHKRITHFTLLTAGATKDGLTRSKHGPGMIVSLYNKISPQSGGLVVKSSKPDKQLDKIRNHIDTYYEVEFVGEGGEDNKPVTITTSNRGRRLNYPDEITRENLADWIETAGGKTAEIFRFTQKARFIGFTVQSYARNTQSPPPFGLLKVSISVTDSGGEQVFGSTKTLRAGDDEVEISLALPAHLSGAYAVEISVFDMLANTDAVMRKSIRL